MVGQGLVVAAALLLAPAIVLPAGAMCIRDYEIDHTVIKSDSVIVFHMRNGNVYQNLLPQRCVGLLASVNGFTFQPTDPATDELCDNLGTFRVNEGIGPGLGGGGQVCMWGTFQRLGAAKSFSRQPASSACASTAPIARAASAALAPVTSRACRSAP